MTFEEKCTWVSLIAVLAVYGAYFSALLVDLGSAPAADIEYQQDMFITVAALVAIMVAGIVLVTIVSRGDDSSDERDKAIGRLGAVAGGTVITVGALCAIAMAMMLVEHFWIANGLLLALVLSEVANAATRLVLYRGGVVPW